MKRFSFGKIVGFILLAIAGLFVVSAIVMALWNNLLTVLFHFPIISLWQALGLLVLCKMLFGGFRGGGWGRGHHWKHNMQRRWMNMSPEEREKFKEEWKNRCGRRFEEGEKTAQ
jgi:hypothetical protein